MITYFRGSHPISKLTPEVWSDVPILEVNQLPHDIDGLKVYQVEYDKENKLASTVDGRAWSNYTTLLRSGFAGKHILKTCKGHCPL